MHAPCCCRSHLLPQPRHRGGKAPFTQHCAASCSILLLCSRSISQYKSITIIYSTTSAPSLGVGGKIGDQKEHCGTSRLCRVSSPEGWLGAGCPQISALTHVDIRRPIIHSTPDLLRSTVSLLPIPTRPYKSALAPSGVHSLPSVPLDRIRRCLLRAKGGLAGEQEDDGQVPIKVVRGRTGRSAEEHLL